MKPLSSVVVAALAGWLGSLAPGLAQAQISPSPNLPVAPDRVGRVIVSDSQAVNLGANTTVDRQTVSNEVKERLQRFERFRDAYLKEQDELRRRLRRATSEQERERIREQIKSSIDAWRERSRNIREELKDRIATLREQMPSRTEILDNARDNVRDLRNQRKRRGQE